MPTTTDYDLTACSGCCTPTYTCGACSAPGTVYVTITGSTDPVAADGAYALTYFGTDGFGRSIWSVSFASPYPGWQIVFACGYALGKNFALDILVSTLTGYRRYISDAPGPTDLVCTPFSATLSSFTESIDGSAYAPVSGMAGVVTP